MTTYYSFTIADYVVGKPISFEEFRGVIENPIAIAEGAVGAPRVVVPTALSTAETNTSKILRPDGSGGVAWSSGISGGIQLTGSGTHTPDFTGTYAVFMIGGGGGGGNDGAGNSGGGGGGYRLTGFISTTSGVGISYAVGAGGAVGVGGGGSPGGDSTFGALTAKGGSGGQASLFGGAGGQGDGAGSGRIGFNAGSGASGAGGFGGISGGSGATSGNAGSIVLVRVA